MYYGSKEETAARIIKKIFRTIFIMQSYFNEYEKFNSYFITPKTNPATQVLIDELIIEAKTLVDAQVNYTVPKIKSTFKIGGANIGGPEYMVAPGNANIGSQYYVSWTINP